MMDLNVMAREVRLVQGRQNSGRGVSCVRDVAMYLERGNLRLAKTVVWSEFDKIRNYPDVVSVLRRLGLMDEVDATHAKIRGE